MKKALFAGSFDPPTLGHLDVIQRASLLFDVLFVGIARNSSKEKVLLTVDQRVAAMTSQLRSHENVKVVVIEGLTVDFAKENDVDVLVRSLRGSSDYAYEEALAYANKQMTGIETLFLPASPSYSAVNATLVREIAWAGGDITAFVPQRGNK